MSNGERLEFEEAGRTSDQFRASSRLFEEIQQYNLQARPAISDSSNIDLPPLTLSFEEADPSFQDSDLPADQKKAEAVSSSEKEPEKHEEKKQEAAKTETAPLKIAGQQITNPDQVQRNLAEGKIVGDPGRKSGGNSGHEQYTGVIEAEDGTKYSVYLRHMNRDQAVSRLRKELAAYKLNSMLEFDNGFPATSVRRFTVDGKEKYGAVQVASGDQLQLEILHKASQKYGSAKPSDLTRLMDEDPKLRRALEQAYLERMVYGDEDAHALNFLVKDTKDGAKVVNIDLDHGFSTNPLPEMVSSPTYGVNKTLFEYFQKKPISPEFQEKLSNFVKKYDNESGRKELQSTGLSKAEVDAMLSRTRWLAEKGTFPEVITADESAHRRELRQGVTTDGERRQREIELTRFRRGMTFLTQRSEEGAEMVRRIGMIPENILRKSGLWDGVQAMNPSTDSVREAYDRAVALDERGTTLTKVQVELVNEIKKMQASGLVIRTTEQLQTLMARTAEDMMFGDKQLTPQEQSEIKKLLEAYKSKDAFAREGVHEALGLKKNPAKVETPVTPDKQAADQSIRDVKRESSSPEQRAAKVAAMVEKGTIRDLLAKSGISEEAARVLEKELLSEKKEERERAARLIDKHYQSKGGYAAFLGEAKGKLGAVAVVASAIIPSLAEIEN